MPKKSTGSEGDSTPQGDKVIPVQSLQELYDRSLQAFGEAILDKEQHDLLPYYILQILGAGIIAVQGDREQSLQHIEAAKVMFANIEYINAEQDFAQLYEQTNNKFKLLLARLAEHPEEKTKLAIYIAQIEGAGILAGIPVGKLHTKNATLVQLALALNPTDQLLQEMHTVFRNLVTVANSEQPSAHQNRTPGNSDAQNTPK